MHFLEHLRIAFRGLGANKLRAGLTVLGIVIGVAAVVTLLSVGRAVETFVTGQFQGIGSNLLFVFAGDEDEDSATQAAITQRDADALADPGRAPAIRGVAPELDGFGTLDRAGRAVSAPVNGVTGVYQDVREWYPAEGSFISDEDVRSGSRVAVLGRTVAEELFPNGEYPIGASMKINGIPFRVVGVMAERGGSAFGDEDNVVFVPISTAQERLYPARLRDGQLRLTVILIQAVDKESMDAAASQAAEILRDRHKIQFREEDDFSIVTQDDLISAFGEVTGVLTIFLGAIAGISLLVGGIGIMNIMLVTVTERTREIGLRKAVGATRRDILWQFVIEAMTLSTLGGLIGVLLGAVGAGLVAGFVNDLDAKVTWDSILLAAGVSVAVGLFFGIYPATRAARLDPIRALRYE